jgi:hypothetical protein
MRSTVHGGYTRPQQAAPNAGPASQRPAIGSLLRRHQWDGPGSHGRSQPWQLGPHVLTPPLEGFAKSGGHAVSDAHVSGTKANQWVALGNINSIHPMLLSPKLAMVCLPQQEHARSLRSKASVVGK